MQIINGSLRLVVRNSRLRLDSERLCQASREAASGEASGGDGPAPGGEPLWRALQGFREIYPAASPALKGTKQAAPGNDPAYCNTIGYRGMNKRCGACAE
jgi:hypothetical protein